jgi:hypothetical protein
MYNTELEVEAAKLVSQSMNHLKYESQLVNTVIFKRQKGVCNQTWLIGGCFSLPSGTGSSLV